MNAKEYLESHWIKNKIWTHLTTKMHQERLRECTLPLEGETFLDVGCGLGHSTGHMKRFLPGDWSGLEFWDKATRVAQELFPDITFYSSKDFNFRPICGEFDSVVCAEVIEHVEDDQGLIDGLLDITKKVLVVTTPNRRVSDPGHLRVYTMGTFGALFHGYALKITDTSRFFYAIVRKE